MSNDFGVPVVGCLLRILLAFEPVLLTNTVDESDDAPLVVRGFANFEEGWPGTWHTLNYAGIYGKFNGYNVS